VISCDPLRRPQKPKLTQAPLDAEAYTIAISKSRCRDCIPGSRPSPSSAVCTIITNVARPDPPSAPDAIYSRLLSPPSSSRALPTNADLSVGPMPAGPGRALNPAGDRAGTAREHLECIADRVLSRDKRSPTATRRPLPPSLAERGSKHASKLSLTASRPGGSSIGCRHPIPERALQALRRHLFRWVP
jgi:hypothetical protein